MLIPNIIIILKLADGEKPYILQAPKQIRRSHRRFILPTEQERPGSVTLTSVTKDKRKHRRVIHMIVLLSIVAVLGFVLFEVAYIKYSGTAVAAPTIPQGVQTIGTGPALTYVVMGDSTAISQGGSYRDGYAVASAQHLARTHSVRWQNLAISGARARDVFAKQLPQAMSLQPDVALIAVGANDVTHLTSPLSVRMSLEQTIAGLRQANPHVKIILTGSPDMGSIPRFAQPVRWLAGRQTNRLNHVIIDTAHDEHVTFAPIAQDTGPTFRRHPELFAKDKFHPLNQGYALWIPVITKAMDQALQ